MAKMLTPAQIKLVEELKVKREELYELALQKRKQMIQMFKKYSKLQNAHEHFVNEHAKIDRKLFLLTPGIRLVEIEKRAAKKKALNSGASITASFTDEEMEKKLRALIALRKQNKAD